MPERDDLDRLIDSELARYAEPRPGLEQRVLSRVETEEANRSNWFLVLHGSKSWALAGAIAAIVLSLALQTDWIPHRESSTTARATTPDHAPVVSPESETPEAHRDIQHVTQIAKNTHDALSKSKNIAAPERMRHPKLDVFPALQPLSPEEQALVAIATGPSKDARDNLIASQRQLDAPLQISSIDIAPLSQPNEGKN